MDAGYSAEHIKGFSSIKPQNNTIHWILLHTHFTDEEI